MDGYIYYNDKTGTIEEVNPNTGLASNWNAQAGGSTGTPTIDNNAGYTLDQLGLSTGGAQTISGPAITAVEGANSPQAVAQAAAAKRLADASRLRGEVTNITNSIRDIYNSRYSLVDNAAKESLGKLDERYATETGDITTQVGDENAQAGAAYSSTGTFDSSYRGNTQDLITKGGERQIRDLGTELEGNKAKIGATVTGQKSSFDAAKAGVDAIAARLAEVSDPAELESIKQTLEGRIRDLQAGGSEFNTMQQNVSAIASLAPAGSRGQQLQTTLTKIVGSGALSPEMKIAMGTRVIQGSGAPQDEQDKLIQALTSDIGTNKQTA